MLDSLFSSNEPSTTSSDSVSLSNESSSSMISSSLWSTYINSSLSSNLSLITSLISSEPSSEESFLNNENLFLIEDINPFSDKLDPNLSFEEPESSSTSDDSFSISSSISSSLY